jgi:hypothetical protein
MDATTHTVHMLFTPCCSIPLDTTAKLCIVITTMEYAMFDVVIKFHDSDEPEAVVVSVGDDQPEEGSDDDVIAFYHFFIDEFAECCDTLSQGFKYKVNDEFSVLNHGTYYVESKKQRMILEPEEALLVDDMSDEEIDAFNADIQRQLEEGGDGEEIKEEEKPDEGVGL